MIAAGTGQVSTGTILLTVNVAASLGTLPAALVATQRYRQPFIANVTLLTVRLSMVAPIYPGFMPPAVTLLQLTPLSVETCHL